jgi:hypothetical protein
VKIESVRIENFRGFKDETILFGDYSCFVGPNGAGKPELTPFVWKSTAILPEGANEFPVLKILLATSGAHLTCAY